MERSIIELVDLPDELLLIIFKKLNNVELLYSIMNTNSRLHRIALDSKFTKNLILFKRSSLGDIIPLIGSVLDRLCLVILPQIQNLIRSLQLESSSIERTLLTGDYSNLYELGLHNIDKNTADRFFTGKILRFYLVV